MKYRSKSAHDLIYDIAPLMNFDEHELNGLLCGADDIERMGTDDLHELVYRLAEQGLLDEESMTNYLAAADDIAKDDSTST